MRGSKYGSLVAVLLACGVVLSACGGGDEGPSRPGSRIGEAGPEAGAPAVGSPGIETVPVSARAASILVSADAVHATSVHGESGAGEWQISDVSCSGTSCSGSGSERGGIGVDDAGWLARAGVLEASPEFDLVWGSDADAESWGGWMRHSGFGVLLEREGSGEDLAEFRYGLAAGAMSDVGPGQNVRAAWRGRMVGITQTGGFAAGRLTGVATLSYRSAEALGDDTEAGDVVGRIDAAFTDIVSVSTGAAFADANFENVPVSLLDVKTREVEVPDPEGPEGATTVEIVFESANMAFGAGVAGNRIRGGFFGPARAEVAGVFEQNGILGAFGAERE